MSFRRNKQELRQWRKWIDTNLRHLTECGIPLTAIESQDNWRYFLDYGYFSDGNTVIIDIDKMPVDKVVMLREFLEREQEQIPYSSTLHRLQQLLKNRIL